MLLRMSGRSWMASLPASLARDLLLSLHRPHTALPDLARGAKGAAGEAEHVLFPVLAELEDHTQATRWPRAWQTVLSRTHCMRAFQA